MFVEYVVGFRHFQVPSMNDRGMISIQSVANDGLTADSAKLKAGNHEGLSFQWQGCLKQINLQVERKHRN